MPGALRLEDLQDFPPPRTYIAEQVYNVPSPTVLYLDLAPSPTQSHALPPSTTTGSPNAYFVLLWLVGGIAATTITLIILIFVVNAARHVGMGYVPAAVYSGSFMTV
ncbi:MAG: hypothetical protein HETSPECPRED_004030 [Heterodermia speciosa]|uniref:Uncharacterized protein n=1 Tax=Heterodermia speciosa TaxID=116794 RepID=A0A8H3F573_9LECA|nr:MAG: hypothetical protein HETSPECPRED_004030 [Heterodermia speciosa]